MALELEIEVGEGVWREAVKGRPRFVAPSDLEEQLTEIAVAVFPLIQQAALEFLPAFGAEPHVIVEEGSVKLFGRILATGSAIYLGIGNYGDFVTGLQTLRRPGHQAAGSVPGHYQAADYIAEHVPPRLHIPPGLVSDRRREPTVADELDSIMNQLSEGRIRPQEAKRRAQALFRGDSPPAGLIQQVELHIDRIAHHIGVDEHPATASRTTRKLRGHKERTDAKEPRKPRGTPAPSSREALPAATDLDKKRRRGVELWQPPGDKVRRRAY